MPIGLGFEAVDVENGVSMSRTEHRFVVGRIDRQIEIDIFLIGLTEVLLDGGLAVVIKTNRKMLIGRRFLANINSGQAFRDRSQKQANAGKVIANQHRAPHIEDT